MKVLAIDIGGSKLMTAIGSVEHESMDDNVHDSVRFLRRTHRNLPSEYNRNTLLSVLYDAVDELGPAEFDRIGITIPGLADPVKGLWVYACFSGIRDFPIVSILAERFGAIPIAIENDVNACALAEKKFGGCRLRNDFLWVTISNGIGGGLILDGQIYQGHFGGAAEIGHFCVADTVGGPPFPCGCGNFGCLEAVAAGPGIAKRYANLLQQTAIQNGQKVDMSCCETPYTAKEIAELARKGDVLARSVWNTTGELIGTAVSYAVNLMNLEAVIFGGGVCSAFDLFENSLKTAFDLRLFRSANRTVALEKTTLGYDAALIGAVAIATARNCMFSSRLRE